jgi:hypothetical protein
MEGVVVDGGLLFANIVVLLIVIASTVYAALCYKKRRSWANVFILRGLIGTILAQVCNIFGLQFHLWSHDVTIKIEYTLCAVGTLSQTMLSLYRFSIFKDVLPIWTSEFLQFKRYAIFIGTVFVVFFIPYSILLYSSSDFRRSSSLILFAHITAWMWYLLWQIFDFGLGIWSLILAFKIKSGLLAKEPMTKRQSRFFFLCIGVLTCILISDVCFWPSMYDLIETIPQRKGIFDEQVLPYLKVATTTMALHISVSFVYLQLIVRFIASSRNKKPKGQTAVVQNNGSTDQPSTSPRSGRISSPIQTVNTAAVEQPMEVST